MTDGTATVIMQGHPSRQTGAAAPPKLGDPARIPHLRIAAASDELVQAL